MWVSIESDTTSEFLATQVTHIFHLLDGACYRAWCLYQLLVVHGQHLIDRGRDESLSSVCQLKERLCFGVFLAVVVFLDLRKSCLHHEAFSRRRVLIFSRNELHGF